MRRGERSLRRTVDTRHQDTLERAVLFVLPLVRVSGVTVYQRKQWFPGFYRDRYGLKLIACVQFVLFLIILGFRLTLVFLEPAGERSVMERQRLQNDIEAVRQAVREGKAGEATNRLFPNEHQEFLQRKQAEDEP